MFSSEKNQMFHSLGSAAVAVLSDLAEKRPARRSSVPNDVGEIERVAWLRATDQRRRIDASLLTEGYSRNWNVRAQAEEIARLEERLD